MTKGAQSAECMDAFRHVQKCRIAALLQKVIFRSEHSVQMVVLLILHTKPFSAREKAV